MRQTLWRSRDVLGYDPDVETTPHNVFQKVRARVVVEAERLPAAVALVMALAGYSVPARRELGPEHTFVRMTLHQDDGGTADLAIFQLEATVRGRSDMLGTLHARLLARCRDETCLVDTHPIAEEVLQTVGAAAFEDPPPDLRSLPGAVAVLPYALVNEMVDAGRLLVRSSPVRARIVDGKWAWRL